MRKAGKLLLYTYGIGDLFFTLMMNMELYFFAAFLTDHAKFSLATTGRILAFTGGIDIVCALAGGVILQKVTLRLGGKYRSWFLVGPPLIAPLIVLQFTRIGSELTAAFVVVSGFVLSHLLFNMVVSSGGAMIGRLTHSPEERTILSASRTQGMSAAGLIFSFTAPAMIAFFSTGAARTSGHAITMAIFAFMMVLGYWYLYWITAGKDPYDEVAEGAAKESGQSIREMVGLALKNRPLLMLVFSHFFYNGSYMILTALATYYFHYVARRPGFLAAFILAVSIARLAGSFAARWIGVRIGKRTTYWAFCALAALGTAAARSVDALWAFLAIFSLAIFFVSIAGAMNTALYSDTVIYGEWKTDRNIRAFTMALMNFSIKIGVLMRNGVVALGLIAIGFVANQLPTPRAVEGIRSMMTLAPALFYALAAVIFYFGYRIDDRDVVRMQEEIAARRTPETAQAFR